MTDLLGFRKKFGVVAPSTNTAVQPEYDDMRPRGVTNHFGRIYIPNDPIRNDEDFSRLLANIRRAMFAAIDQVMTCEPDYLILGMSSETFWEGLEGSMRLRERVEAHAGVKVAMGSDASQAALKKLGDIRRISVITPYMPIADEQVRRFFTDCGFEIVRLKGLRCASPVAIAHASERTLRDAILEVNGPDVDAIVQVGTNLIMARLAGIAEFWLDKPVVAINTATYWYALRENGLDAESKASARCCCAIRIAFPCARDPPLIVGISGASGAIYGVRLLEALHEKKIPAHLIVSKSAALTLKEETDVSIDHVRALAQTTYQNTDIGAAISSGSFRTRGMVIAPCSIRTLSDIAYGTTDSLLSRAADVTLKERRRLVLVVREAPLHAGHLRSMLAATESGAVIVPPVPAFYHRPKTIDDIINQTVGRCLDLFDIDVGLVKRWRTESDG